MYEIKKLSEIMQAAKKYNFKPENSLIDQVEKLEEIAASAPKNNPAKWAHAQLMQIVKDFEETLNDEQETGLKIISLGNASIYYVKEIDYRSPYILVFHCVTQNGEKAVILQHYSQLNFVLIVLPKLNAEKSARRVGFITHQDTEDLAVGNSNS
ncbi:MAG: hypothetical protein IJ859_03835 [Synergistaceae bacterium]|nr:hypothetical protein [Synergistaceae bacterium]